MSWEHIQCGGISGYFTEKAHFLHNDLRKTPYAGFHFGWWWGNAPSYNPGCTAPTWPNNNKINYNRVSHSNTVLEDSAPVYILGLNGGTSWAAHDYANSSNWSEIIGNYLTHTLHENCNGIHPDDSASFWKIRENVIEDFTKDWIHMWSGSCINEVTDNFSTAANTTLDGLKGTIYPVQPANPSDKAPAECVTLETSAPPWTSPTAQATIANAGLEAAYSHLHDLADPILVDPYLSDLQLDYSDQGWGQLGYDMSIGLHSSAGEMISLGGVEYNKGLKKSQ